MAEVAAVVAYMARANASVSCPHCGSLPLDESGTCPANACVCYGLSTTSPLARKLAVRWAMGERPWRPLEAS